MTKPDKILVVPRDPSMPPSPDQLREIEAFMGGSGDRPVLGTTACVDIYQFIGGRWEKVGVRPAMGEAIGFPSTYVGSGIPGEITR